MNQPGATGGEPGPSGDVDVIEGTAAEIKSLTQGLRDAPSEILERIVVISPGSQLRQGATYLDLNAPQMGEFVATGDMTAGAESKIVPKAQTDYEAWNWLLQRFGLDGDKA